MKMKSLKMCPVVSLVFLIMVTFICKPGPVYATSILNTDKEIYNQGEAITVHFSDWPGIGGDWMCIAPAGSQYTKAGR